MLKCIFYPRVSMAPALLMLTMLAAPLALAVTFIVNDSTVDLPDTNPASGTCHTTANTCTLRAAVMQANRASAPSATIMVPAGIYNLTIPAITGADGDDNGDLNLTAPSNGFDNSVLSAKLCDQCHLTKATVFQRMLRQRSLWKLTAQ